MTNFHTHTYRCGHAVGNVSDYVTAAIRKKISHLGFSDHVPLPDNRWSHIRMPYSELPDYNRDIDEAKESFKEIKIYKGAECDFDPAYTTYFQDVLLGEYGMDFLAGSIHYFPLRGEWVNCYDAFSSKDFLFAYTESLIEVIDCGLFSYIAHPDLFGCFYLSWDKETIACSKAILEAASERNSVLEINSYGYRKGIIDTPAGIRRPYPLDDFWSLAADYDIQVIVNSDAHSPEDVAAFGEGFNLVERLHLNVVDSLF